ncbi:proline-rich protein HaeIII subfamily 1-like [Elephas maximus indicus]|uniref:proline-rich protein HaeIII subfamily 1-like n=1 Tax=Elephas maximus indicus TaxID=99487 RepID=UPI002115DD2F|nr:proline-rich protein HaeIII subfamily 1-like [Elephas maximus indicus]
MEIRKLEDSAGDRVHQKTPPPPTTPRGNLAALGRSKGDTLPGGRDSRNAQPGGVSPQQPSTPSPGSHSTRRPRLLPPCTKPLPHPHGADTLARPPKGRERGKPVSTPLAPGAATGEAEPLPGRRGGRTAAQASAPGAGGEGLAARGSSPRLARWSSRTGLTRSRAHLPADPRRRKGNNEQPPPPTRAAGGCGAISTHTPADTHPRRRAATRPSRRASPARRSRALRRPAGSAHRLPPQPGAPLAAAGARLGNKPPRPPAPPHNMASLGFRNGAREIQQGPLNIHERPRGSRLGRRGGEGGGRGGERGGGGAGRGRARREGRGRRRVLARGPERPSGRAPERPSGRAPERPSGRPVPPRPGRQARPQRPPRGRQRRPRAAPAPGNARPEHRQPQATPARMTPPPPPAPSLTSHAWSPFRPCSGPPVVPP